MPQYGVEEYIRRCLRKYIGQTISPHGIEEVSKTVKRAIENLHRPIRKAEGSKALNGRPPRMPRGKADGDFVVKSLKVEVDAMNHGVINYEVEVSRYTRPLTPSPEFLATLKI